MNLKKIDDVPEEETSLACAKETPKRDDRLTSRVKLMSCMELREFLVQHFQEKSLPDEAFTCLENQRVCGEIFLTLTERDLKEILPDAEFGTIRHLSLLIEQLLPDAEFGAIRHLSLLIKQLTEQPPWGKNVLQSFCCEMLEATMAFCGL
ncbi:hypothetical protein PoB_002274100 [Plakobranchus ocellatus]|uniref:Uncharacterized protein n=1 Tax=Plakobranchus ocellatus TaxID=259542 RepID=A0AAV3ZNY8_9GAST|nr:hypothetical protein PoB_002274100 [Plakobranchus ocellatus]